MAWAWRGRWEAPGEAQVKEKIKIANDLYLQTAMDDQQPEM